jgi:hypothetical protein
LAAIVRGAGGEELSGIEGCRSEVELGGRISKAVCNELAAQWLAGESGTHLPCAKSKLGIASITFLKIRMRYCTPRVYSL